MKFPTINSKEQPNLARRFFALAALSTPIVTFIYGLGVGYFKWFPFYELKKIKNKLIGHDTADISYPHLYVSQTDFNENEKIKVFLINLYPSEKQSKINLYIFSAINLELINTVEVTTDLMISKATFNCIDLDGNKCENLFEYELDFHHNGSYIISTQVSPKIILQSPNTAFFTKYKKINKDNKIRVGCVYPDFTWFAYNVYGGKSLYTTPFPIPGQMSSAVVSPNRPQLQTDNSKSVFSSSIFQKLLLEMGIQNHALTNSRIHFHDDWKNLELIILTSHDEYWSKEIYEKLQSYLENGGNIAIFSGNTAFRSLEISEKEHRRVIHWEQVTPPEQVIGLSFRYGGIPVRVNNNEISAKKIGLPAGEFKNLNGMKVLNSTHPIYKDTGLKDGDYIGLNSELVWGEIDGIPLDFKTNKPLLTRKPATSPLYDGTTLNDIAPAFPSDIKVLASSWLQWFENPDGLQYAGTIIDARIKRGRVINLGSMGWSRSLAKGDPVLIKIFNNVVIELLGSK